MLYLSGIVQTISQGLWRRTTTPPILLPGTILHCTLSNMELPGTLFICWFDFLCLLSNLQLCEMARGSRSPSGSRHHLHRRQWRLDRVLQGGHHCPKQIYVLGILRRKWAKYNLRCLLGWMGCWFLGAQLPSHIPDTLMQATLSFRWQKRWWNELINSSK